MSGSPPTPIPSTPQNFVAAPAYSPQLMIHNHHRPLKRPRVSSKTLSNQKVPYKMELCLNFQRGKCGFGDNCHYAHGVADLRGRLNPRFCWRYSRSEAGGCPYGERCHFSHDKGYRKSVAINIVNGRSGVYNHGFQRFGNDKGGGLRFNAGNQKPLGWKTRPCNKWEANGCCPYGLNCFFAHGESELQKSGCGKASEYATTPKQQVQGKQWRFKWNDVEKISRIYADWIETMPLVHGSSGTVRS